MELFEGNIQELVTTLLVGEELFIGLALGAAKPTSELKIVKATVIAIKLGFFIEDFTTSSSPWGRDDNESLQKKS